MWRLFTALRRIDERTEHMAATLADIDGAIAAQTSVVGSLKDAITKTSSDIDALIAKVEGGTVTPQDFTAELQILKSNTDLIAQAVTDASAADTKAGGTLGSGTVTPTPGPVAPPTTGTPTPEPPVTP